MIDQDKLAEEIERLQEWLNENDPSSKEYEAVSKRFTELVKLGLEVEKAHDDQIERHDRVSLEEDKLRRNQIEADEKRRAEKRQAWFELIKIGISTVSTLALIVAILVSEELQVTFLFVAVSPATVASSFSFLPTPT